LQLLSWIIADGFEYEFQFQFQFQFHPGEEWTGPTGMMNQNIFGDIAVAMLFL
jgi:hypothetical protein